MIYVIILYFLNVVYYLFAFIRQGRKNILIDEIQILGRLINAISVLSTGKVIE